MTGMHSHTGACLWIYARGDDLDIEADTDSGVDLAVRMRDGTFCITIAAPRWPRGRRRRLLILDAVWHLALAVESVASTYADFDVPVKPMAVAPAWLWDFENAFSLRLRSRVAAALLALAVRPLPAAERAGYLEEFAGELLQIAATGSWRAQLGYALRVVCSAPLLRRALHSGR